MKSRIYLLIKVFDKEEYADAFVEKGELFCRPLGDFKGIKDGDKRGDRFEAVTDWHQPDRITLTLSVTREDGVRHTIPAEDLAGPVVMQKSCYDRLNLYCMYAVKVPDFEEEYETEEERLRGIGKINAMLRQKTTLSDDFLSLGGYAVVVYRVEEFIDRVVQAASEGGFSCWHRHVEYYDPETFHGSFGELEAVFSKRDVYQGQSEYRFAFGSHAEVGPKVFRLGSLQGVAVKVSTREINDKLELRLAER